MNHLSKKILFVSDNKFMHIIIKDTLKPHKVNVVDVYSAEEAIRMLKEFDPDLILSDIDMPGMTGIELCRYLKETAPAIPLVIYSSSENNEDIQEAFASGAKGYIVKKYHNKVLAEKIMHYIR